MIGFSIRELAELLNGVTKNADHALDNYIDDFEYQAHLLNPRNSDHNAFIAISNSRWNIVNNKKTNWIDGSKQIEKSYINCSLVITEEEISCLPETITQIIVTNTYETLAIIGDAARRRSKAHNIGITGSVGKTTTRILIDFLLSDTYKVLATRGNHNTQAGVLLFSTKLAQDINFAIAEISLNALNNKFNQSLRIKPDTCIVTSIGAAHLSTLHTTKNIAIYKARIFMGLQPNGLAIINHDIPSEEFDILFSAASRKTNRIKTFSMYNQDADICLIQISNEKYLQKILVKYNQETYELHVPMAGDGIIENVLCALLYVLEQGLPIEKIQEKLLMFKSLPRIMELKKIQTADNRQVDILDDTHNAAIPSMINAIRAFNQKSPHYQGRKILVIGQVQDLGSAARALHEEIRQELLNSKADIIFGHGDLMRDVIKNIPTDRLGGWFDNASDLSLRIPLYCTDDSLVLMKGSVSGSDFQKISTYLPPQIEHSTRALQNLIPSEINQYLYPNKYTACYTTKDSKLELIKEEGDNSTKALEGIMPLILLILALKSKKPKSVKETNRLIPLNDWDTNDGTLYQDTPFITGTKFKFSDLVNALFTLQHPSAIFEISHYLFGSRENAYYQALTLAEEFGISSSALSNLTGRYRVKEQQCVGINDLTILATQLHKALSNQGFIKPIFDSGLKTSVYKSVWGKLRKNGIYISDHLIYIFIGFSVHEDLDEFIINN